METNELVNITVIIAERSYPLKVKQEDVNKIRKIVEEVNDKINQFQKTYSRKDKQDYLSMALLTYAVDLHKTHPAPASNISEESYDIFNKKVDQLDELLDFLLE